MGVRLHTAAAFWFSLAVQLFSGSMDRAWDRYPASVASRAADRQMLGGAGQYLREEPRLSSIEFKQRMENAYRDGTAPWETGQPCSEIQRRLLAGDLPTSGTALDLGCGSGVQTLLLAAHELEVVGVDLSTTAIEGAQRRASSHPAGRRARFIAGDVAEVRGIGEPVDVLVDRGCYHLARGDHLDAFLHALRRHSRSGSLLLVVACSAAEQPEFPVAVVTEEELRSELGGLFEVTDLRSCRLD